VRRSRDTPTAGYWAGDVQENVEIVRRGYEAFNRGDIDGVVGLLAPDFEYVASGLVPGVGGVYRGAEGLRGFAETFWASSTTRVSRSMNYRRR
jgi:uncharacterized protein